MRSARFESRLIGLLAALALAACASPTPSPPGNTELARGGWQNRYLRYGDEFDYLVGFDVQQLHADVGIDYREKIDFLHSHGINKIRIWLYASWFGLPGDANYPTGGQILHPWRVDAASNKFDLDRWDEAFWQRTRDVIDHARARGIVVEISLFSIQEPRVFFRRDNTSYAFRNTDNLQSFGKPTDANGGFVSGFFALGYTDNGRSLYDYQRALIDKALLEFGAFGNVYFELINESPGPRRWIESELPHAWMKYWLRYLDARTDQLLTTHSVGFMTLDADDRERWTVDDFSEVGRRYWSEGYVDGFNFHFYADDPRRISEALHPYQARGLALICNEGGTFYSVDRSRGYPDFRMELDADALHREIRHAWGMMTAGGYYSIYFGPVPLLGNEVSRRAARAMQAMRRIVETIRFEQLRPVRDDGGEFDDVVTRGPAADWQVIADPGVAYIVYFWGSATSSPAVLSLPSGRYRYAWFDTREPGPALASGPVPSSRRGSAVIEGPPAGTWTADAGLVLVVNAR
jgi:hypothetical protein